MKNRRIVWIVAGLFVLLWNVPPVTAGWFGDAVQGAVEGIGNRAVNEAADSTYEGAKEAGKKAIDSEEEAAEEEPSGDSSAEVPVYPGALYDKATSQFIRDSLSLQGACYRTGDSLDKVAAFYAGQNGLKSVSKTEEGAMFQQNGGAARGGVDVTVQSPWKNMNTGQMMNDTLITIASD